MKESIIYIDTPSAPEVRWAQINKPQKSFDLCFSDKNDKPFAKITQIIFNGKFLDILYLNPKSPIEQRIRMRGNKLIGDIDFTKTDYVLRIYSNDYYKTIHVKTTKNSLILENR